jgi:hypothetical protein
MTKRRWQGMAGSILEQFATLRSDYEIGKALRYKRAKTGIMTLVHEGRHRALTLGDARERYHAGQRSRRSRAPPGVPPLPL